jgi:hypothetical protein
MGFMWLGHEAMLAAERHPNVSLETSFSSLDSQRNAIHALGPNASSWAPTGHRTTTTSSLR